MFYLHCNSFYVFLNRKKNQRINLMIMGQKKIVFSATSPQYRKTHPLVLQSHVMETTQQVASLSRIMLIFQVEQVVLFFTRLPRFQKLWKTTVISSIFAQIQRVTGTFEDEFEKKIMYSIGNFFCLFL